VLPLKFYQKATHKIVSKSNQMKFMYCPTRVVPHTYCPTNPSELKQNNTKSKK